MFELTGLDGTLVFVRPGAIARFRYIDFADPASGTKVDYAGRATLTAERAEDLRARLGEQVRFIQLTVRAEVPVWVNPGMVAEVRTARPGIAGGGCELIVAGQYQHVIDDLETVLGRIAD